jgi:hypothetical protein
VALQGGETARTGLARSFGFAILLTVLALGCEDSVSPPGDPDILPDLIGQWEWLGSCGGFVYGCSTPQSTGQAMNWVFGADGIFQWFSSDSLFLSGPFRVVRGELGIWNREANLLWVNDAPMGLALELVASDTLRAIEDCVDCFTSLWARRR